MNIYTMTCAHEVLENVAPIDAEMLEESLKQGEPCGLDVHFDPETHELFISGEEFLSIDDLPEEFLSLLGEILRKAGKKYLGFGVAFFGDRPTVESAGGCEFRIYQDGRCIEPGLVWPDT